MSKKEAPISQLQEYLPSQTFQGVHDFLQQYRVHLTIAKERKSILGDYRHPTHGSNHRISINGNLNQYSFLITLLHELGHLLTFEKYGHTVAAHGKEWKIVFGQLLAQFIEKNIFPLDIKKALMETLHNPAASSCADEHLLRILKKYDPSSSTLVFIEAISEGAHFQTHDGRVFRKEKKLRKRYRCVEVNTRKIYLFSPVFEAELVGSDMP